MASSRASKSHYSALCWIPPEAQQPPIQALRNQFDKQIERWPPHVNLLYPFVPVEQFSEAAVRVAEALRGLPAFNVVLDRMQSFRHSKKSMTAWLDPTVAPGNRWQTLQAACLAAFPCCTDQTDRGSFVPHLTIGQFKDAKRLEALQADLDQRWQPLECSVGDVCLISRRGD